MEGIFTYVVPADGVRGGPSQTHRHVFHSESVTPTTPPPSETNGSPRSMASIRGAFGAIRKRSGSISSLRSGNITPGGGGGSSASSPTPRSYPFSFEIPTKSPSGEEFPPTFYTANIMEGGIRARSVIETAEVTYRLLALWEAEDGSDDHAL
jgi:hypothetical protein